MPDPTLADLAARLTILEQKISHLETATGKLGDRYDATRDKLQALEVQMAEIKTQMTQILETGQSTLELLKRQIERQAQRADEREDTATALKHKQLEITSKNWREFWKVLAGIIGVMAAAASGSYATIRFSHQSDPLPEVEVEVEVEGAEVAPESSPTPEEPPSE